MPHYGSWVSTRRFRREVSSSPPATDFRSWSAPARTKALRKAFEAAARLPDREQEELAAAILEELAADGRWEATFAEPQSTLKRLADEALKEHRAGRTEGLDPDAL